MVTKGKGWERDLPNPGIEPRSPALQADTLPSEPPGKLPNIYTLLFIKQITNKNLPYNTGNYTQYFVITYREKESEKK